MLRKNLTNVPKSNSTSIIGDTLFCSARCNCHQVVGVYVHFYYLPSLQALFANREDTPLCQMISMSSKTLPNAKSRCPEISVSNLNNWTRMHSSRMHTAHGSIRLQGGCLSACWDTLPQVWAWRHPPGWPGDPPRCGSGDLLGVGMETPQVWA